MNIVLGFLAFLIAGPLVGGLLAGFDRILTARMQSRKGPPLLQPFYDIFKLWDKRGTVVNRFQSLYILCFLIFVLIAGGLFFAGGDLLVSIFALTVGAIFFVMAAHAANSPYSNIGAERELLQMMMNPIRGGKRVVCALSSESADDLSAIAKLVEDGTITVVVDRSFPLERIAEAHAYAESDVRSGSVVVSSA